MYIENIKQEFIDQFNTKPILIQSPGRINLIGEHTDYNEGFVMPAAIDKYIYLAISKNESSKDCSLLSLDYDESFQFSLSKVKPLANGTWQNYILGVVDGILKKGKKIAGFQAIFAGDIPKGAGLSSSAALENAFVFALNELFDLGLSKVEMIHISQKAEHTFVGVNCGIMDQFSSMMGVQNKVLLLDCRSLETEEVELNFEGYELLLINSNVKHNLADSAYNQRRAECEEGVRVLQKYFSQIKALRDVSMEQLASIKNEVSEIVFKRCTYIIKENQRVLAMREALKNQNISRVGDLLFEGHEGMKTQYEITCPEIDFLVAEAQKSEWVIGARMMGGGFGGCTLNLIQKGKSPLFTTQLQVDYQEKFQKEFSLHQVKIGSGTKVIAV